MERTLEGHGAAVTACMLSGDERRLVLGSEDKMLKMWDLRAGAAQGTAMFLTVAEHQGLIYAGDAAGNP